MASASEAKSQDEKFDGRNVSHDEELAGEVETGKSSLTRRVLWKMDVRYVVLRIPISPNAVEVVRPASSHIFDRHLFRPFAIDLILHNAASQLTQAK